MENMSFKSIRLFVRSVVQIKEFLCAENEFVRQDGSYLFLKDQPFLYFLFTTLL